MPVAARKIDYPTEHHGHADDLLRKLGEITGQLKTVQSECQVEMDALVQRHREKVAPLKQQLELLDKSLRKHSQKYQVDLFKGRDRVDLKCGALLHQVDRRVKRIRDMLQRLEQLGSIEAIKIVKSVDWDVIETWTDERLIEVGTERVKKETFAYELFSRK